MSRDINEFGLYDEIIINYLLTHASLSDRDITNFLMSNYYFFYHLRPQLGASYWRQRFANVVKEEKYPGALALARHCIYAAPTNMNLAAGTTLTETYPQLDAGFKERNALNRFLVEKNKLIAGMKNECVQLLRDYQPNIDTDHDTVNPFNDPCFVEFIYAQLHAFVKRPIRWREGGKPVTPRIDPIEDQQAKNNAHENYVTSGVVEDTERLLIARIRRKHKTINIPSEIKVDLIFKRTGVNSGLSTKTSLLEIELHVTQFVDQQLEGILRVIFNLSAQHINLFSTLPLHACFLWHHHVSIKPVFMLSAFTTAGLKETTNNYLRAMEHENKRPRDESDEDAEVNLPAAHRVKRL